MKLFCLIALFLLPAAASVPAASLAIDSLSGPVTQNEVNSFIAYMQTQSPPPTPWGPVNGTGHNDWADGTGGRDLEAMGEMFEVSSNMTILNLMINWADDCTSQRNDLMSVTNGGQRVLWTGLIDKVWVPNWLTDATDGQSNYCGCESEDTVGHIAFCAKLILQTPAIWNLNVPDGDPYGYGFTYFQRATNYLAKCDEANDEYFLKWFIQSGSNLIRPPSNPAWTALNENVTANNRQMMFTSGFQRLAEAHELLGDNPARVAQYDAIVKASTTEVLNGMVNYPGNPRASKGQTIYDWGYYPTSTSGNETTEIHAEYDMIGVWRAFNRPAYGFSLSPLVPFANTMVDVVYLGTNTFAGDVGGASGTQSPIYSGWILTADWNPQVYATVAGAAYGKNWYQGSPDIDAGILLMKSRRYLEFSVTPSPASAIVQAGGKASFTVAVAPLGGFSNTVSLSVSGLPSGATPSFSLASVNCGTLNVCSTNSILSIQTSVSTPVGAYPVSIIGASAGVSHTNTVNLVVGNYSLSASPPSQTVSRGGATSYTVTVATNTGFSGTVSFGLSGLPANCSAAFSPGSLAGAGSATLNVVASNNAAAGIYPLTISGTNGAVVATTAVTFQIAGAATAIWNGGSGSGSDWSDASNWNGVLPVAGNSLLFGGSARLANTNDLAAATIYTNVIFNPGAGAFVLNGNSVTLAGNITNDSSNPQMLNLGLNFGGSLILNGTSNLLSVVGGLTNTFGSPGAVSLILGGSGQLSDLWKSSASPGGTNIIAMNDAAADWTIMHNPASAAAPVPWAIEITNGTLNFGSASSAPVVNSSTPHNSPADNQIGLVSGATATFNMVNGTLTTSSRFNTALAANATGILNQSGGTLNMAEQFQGANGSNPGEVSQINISGGTLNIGGGIGPIFVASRGTGTLTVSGSAVVNCATLDVSRNAYGNTLSSVGEVDLNGGTLMVTLVTNVSANAQTGGSPSASFYFNGGTLVAKAGAKTMFFQGSLVTPVTPIMTIVQAGGAVIDDGGNAITIGEPLQHDNSLGALLDGGLAKLDSGTLTLIAVNSYNGPTTVAAGTLALSGNASISNSAVVSIASGATLDASVHNGGAWTVVNGQTLTGAGMVKGNITITNGATFAPGGSLNTLAFNGNLSLAGGSATTMELNKTLTTNDAVQVAGNLTLGGTLTLVNLSGTLTNGDAFKLFSAGSLGGGFTNIVPAIPAVNEAWNSSTLPLDGTLRVTNSPTPPPGLSAVMTGGGILAFTAANGPVNYPVTILSSTNVGLSLPQWTVVAATNFDASGNLQFTNALNPDAPLLFYILQLQ